MKVNFETLEDGRVRLEVIGEADEVAKIQQFIMTNMAGFLAGLKGTATKERVDE